MSESGARFSENIVPIVFNCLEGSVSHYYHFFYGALIPLIEYHIANPDKKLLITTDVGPFRSILLELFTPEIIVGFEMPVISEGAKYFDDKSMNWVRIKKPGEVILPAYDVFNADIMRNRDKSQNRLRRLLEIRPTILQFIEDRMPSEYRTIPTFEIVLLERAIEKYYVEKSKTNTDKGREIFYTSGKQRRDITNHKELYEGLQSSFSPKLGNIVLEGKSIFYQFQLFRNAKIVIGQHGAGLANIFFMGGHANLIEIMSPWGRKGDHFRNLANTLHIHYDKFDLESDIGSVDVPVIIQMVHIRSNNDIRPRYEVRTYGDRPRYEDRSYGDRSYGNRSYGDRPRYEDRSYGDRRPRYEDRSYGDRRPRYEDRSYSDRSYGDRPRYEDRDNNKRWGGKQTKKSQRRKNSHKQSKTIRKTYKRKHT